ncbi:MAG TPA: GAF domain-containing protein [Gaiellaceae bacterium]|nr:GAF domain-containing protein [Gaiellaceae bacterium]
MSAETKAVVFNAVPLFAVAAAYLAVAVAVAPRLWRERAGLTANDLALGLMFPCLGIPAAILGAAVLDSRNAIGGHLWFSFAASLIALLPALVFLARWGERGELLSGGPRAREAEQLVSVRGRELEAVAATSDALARTADPESAARVLLDQVGSVLGIEFTALALIDGEAEEARGLLARDSGADVTWWRDIRIDLRNEPSGIASAYFQAAPVVVFDCSASPLVSPRLVEAVGAKSGAFVPLIVEERIIGVLVAAPTSAKRAFSSEEVTLMQSLAAEAALALARTRSAGQLDEALAREQLVADISRRVRSVEGLADGTRIAVTEIGRALRASRCFIRLGQPGELQQLAAEWFAAGLQPIGPQTQNLPAANLAAVKRRTVVVSDIDEAPELEVPELGTTETMRRLGTKSLVATPMIAFDRSIGVLGLHRATAGPWSEGEVALIESVARELALAINSARLLDENRQRLLEQTALLRAAQVVTSELELEAVLQRLVDEVARLLGCEAADCYLLDRERGMLRCAAVHGLEPELVGFEFASDQGLAGRAIRQRAPALSDDYAQLPDSVPHPAYRGYASAIVVPMMWSDQIRGVLGVGTHDPDHTLTSSDAELLEAFATLAALALRNAESFEERSRQARTQRAFYDIASLLALPISQAETLRAVARAAAEALGGSSSALLMPREEAFELAAGHGLPQEVAALVRDAAAGSAEPLATCARKRTVIAASALAEDDRFDPDWRDVAASVGYGSLLAVPVQAPEGRDGLVVVFFEESRRFSDYDLELARNLAGTARGALERSELYESERRARGLAQQLARTGTLLATELDPAAVLDEIVAQAPALLGADAAVVRLLEDDELVVSAVGGELPEGLLESRSPATGWAAADAIQTRAPVAIGDVEGEGPGASDPALAAGYRAFLAVPLVGSEGGMQGVLSVYAQRPRTWQPEEAEALGALAGNASAALASAELYQRVALEKERSVAILANIADGIVAVDREEHVVLWNEAAERITGVRASDAIGRSTEQALQRTLASGDETSADAGGDRLLAIRRGDEDVWLSLTEAIMRDPAGAVAGRIFAFRDISAERVVEQMKSDFVTAVSHELRTPLTSIYGFAETLLRQDVLFGEEERRTFLGYIASESDRLTTIVDQLLNVARLDTGDLQVNLAPIDIRAVVSDVVQTAQQAPAANGHDFFVDLPEHPVDAEADGDKLRQILSNLVDNAIKFSPDGGRVTVAARVNDEVVEVTVADEGIGIPEEEQRRIFTKFYRGESMTRDPSTTGTGLGLFIAHGLVSAMGGRMWVDSREGAGSSFAFELPLAPHAALSGRETG